MTWRYVLAAALALHGVIHLIGFIIAWFPGRFASLPGGGAAVLPSSRIAAVRVLGLAWLAALALFVAAALLLGAGAAGWKPAAAIGAVLSLALCLVWWRDAKVGAFVDVAVLIAVALV